MIGKILFLAIGFVATTATAQLEAQSEERREPRDPPPHIARQLTAEQLAELRALPTREEKRELLTSWGIELPPPPPHEHGRRGHRRHDRECASENASAVSPLPEEFQGETQNGPGDHQ